MPPVRAALLIALGLCAACAPASAATLTFRGGGEEAPPATYEAYLEHVYCGRLPIGAASQDRDCLAVRRWLVQRLVRPVAARPPAPLLD
jgi:hypothetical protein